MKKVIIIGGGLAGCQAAILLKTNGYKVMLYDCKPQSLLSAYKIPTFGELVCNNALSPLSKYTPLGMLVKELKELGSEIIKIAQKCKLNDPKFFAIDKKLFSKKITNRMKELGIEIINEKLLKIPKEKVTAIIIATGPLTEEKLLQDISKKSKINNFYFSDASSIIIDIRSIDLKNSLIKKVSDDLFEVNLPNTIFTQFTKALKEAKSFENEVDESFEFDKCLTIEKLARLGDEVLEKTRFRYENKEGAHLLLRRESALENGFIMVGCMTALPHQEQKKAISILPGFSNCKIIKYGRMHRNSFFNSPQCLDSFYRVKNSNTYIIGQLSGIDGYAPAISSGLVAALRIIYGDILKPFPKETMIGGLANYVSNYNGIDFQPMCASFALLSSKSESYAVKSEKSIREYKRYLQTLNCKI